MKLSIIIVSHNAFDLVKSCLHSIYQNYKDDLEVILIDNASTDPGIDEISKAHPMTTIIQNKKNVGFAKGVNQGLKSAKGEYMVILNPDAVILPGTLSYALSYVELHPEVGLVGCRIFSKEKKVQLCACHTFPNLLSHLYEYNYLLYKIMIHFIKDYHPLLYSANAHRKELFPTHLIGVFLLIRKSVLTTVGFFDERFFLYREETDFCRRIIKAGLQIRYLPKIGGVIHYGGGSSKIKMTQASPHYLESTYLFFQKYHGKVYTIFAWFLGLVSALTSLFLIYALLGLKKGKGRNKRIENLEPWREILIWHVTSGVKVVFSQ